MVAAVANADEIAEPVLLCAAFQVKALFQQTDVRRTAERPGLFVLDVQHLGISWKPANWKRDVIFRGALGAYHQPPFYRELRGYDGKVNTQVKAQRSYQVVAGMDYNFKSGNRPFRFTAEAYYKHLTNVNPYDIDNVRIRRW